MRRRKPDTTGTFRRRTESFRADDQHRRLRVDIVGGRAAETEDERARILASERAEFSGKYDELSQEGRAARVTRGCGQTASQADAEESEPLQDEGE